MRLNALAIAAEGARFAQQNQQEVESSDNSVEVVENAAAETLPVAEPVENEPVVVSFIPSVVEPKVTDLEETVKMDLSVPVAAMRENETKSKRGRPSVKKTALSEDQVATPVKRRGRPAKKTAEAEA